MNVHAASLCFALLALPTLAAAQTQPGDLMVRANPNGNAIAFHRTDGTLVTGAGGPSTDWRMGCALLPDGGWATFRLDPGFAGWFFMRFDPQGALVSEVLTDRPADVQSFAVDTTSDGVVLVSAFSGLTHKIHRYRSDGTYIGFFEFGPLSMAANVLCPTSDGGFWAFHDGFVQGVPATGQRFDRDGNVVDSVTLDDEVKDVALAHDGTFWATKWGSRTVSHFAATGQTIESFDFDLGVTSAGQLRSPSGVTVAVDGTVWVTVRLSTQVTHLDATGQVLGSFDAAVPLAATEVRFVREPAAIGTAYCGSVVNSTGVRGVLEAYGSRVVVDGALELRAHDLPRFTFGFMLVSEAEGFVMNPAGSAGNLCLGGAIGRFVGPGQIQNSGVSGSIALAVDLAEVPTPTGPVAVAPGDSYRFQAWYRDSSPAGSTSNFTNGVRMDFL